MRNALRRAAGRVRPHLPSVGLVLGVVALVLFLAGPVLLATLEAAGAALTGWFHRYKHVVPDWLYTGVLMWAWLVQLAVIRDRTIKEVSLAESMRWLGVAALFTDWAQNTHRLFTVGSLEIRSLSLISWSAVALMLIAHGMLQICDRRKRRLLERLERRRKPIDRRQKRSAVANDRRLPRDRRQQKQ